MRFQLDLALASFGAILLSGAPAPAFDWKTHSPATFLSSDISKAPRPPVKLPERDNARIFADFDGDGIDDYFVGAVRYISYFSMDEDPATARKSDFRIYKGAADGTFTLDHSLLDGDAQGCIHPRKALVNDFNGDKIADIFVACHGWDKDPHPGEISKIVLSQPDGPYQIRDAVDSTGFVHSATSADFDGDGTADILLTDSNSKHPVQLWNGKGDGTFTRNPKFKLKGIASRLPYFTSEAVDFDGDGHFDLFVAGVERGNAPAYFYLNGADKGFSPRKRITIPAVKGAGTVLDVMSADTAMGGTGKGGTAYILRTGDAATEDYRGIYIQSVDLSTGAAKMVYENKDRLWFPWLTAIKTADGVSFGSDDPYEKPVDGRD